MMDIIKELFLYNEEDKKYKLNPKLTLKLVEELEKKLVILF